MHVCLCLSLFSLRNINANFKRKESPPVFQGQAGDFLKASGLSKVTTFIQAFSSGGEPENCPSGSVGSPLGWFY